MRRAIRQDACTGAPGQLSALSPAELSPAEHCEAFCELLQFVADLLIRNKCHSAASKIRSEKVLDAAVKRFGYTGILHNPLNSSS
jgi:hypothetical protein